jgi:hypothetical protein
MRPHAQLISVVDDDASIRQALAGLFRSVGSPVATFATAEEFLRSDRPSTTACLVLDLQMPGTGGHGSRRSWYARGIAFRSSSTPRMATRRHGCGPAGLGPSRSCASPSTRKPCGARSRPLFEIASKRRS